MSPSSRSLFMLAPALLLWSLGQQAFAQSPCDAFKWNVKREVALFAGTSIDIAGAPSASEAQFVEVGRLYRVKLLPQHAVKLDVAVKRGEAGDHAGMLQLKAPSAGTFLVAIDTPARVEIAAGKIAIASKDFQAHTGCTAPSKIVEFELSAGTPLVLQLSGSRNAEVRVSITPRSTK